MPLNKQKVLSWFSCGASSAIATSIALRKYKNIDIVYIDTNSEHPDNKRFLKDCENWFGHEITVIRSYKYKDVDDVINKTNFINSQYGAACTLQLKKEVRNEYLKDKYYNKHILGFDFSKHEINRYVRFQEQYPQLNVEAPLIDNRFNKNKCLAILKEINIDLPKMYKLGYNHNNCIGCVKGGKGYWNKIKIDFPEVFEKRAEQEIKIGHTCIKNTYLKNLKYKISKKFKEPICDIFCELEMEKLISPKTINILGGSTNGIK